MPALLVIAAETSPVTLGSEDVNIVECRRFVPVPSETTESVSRDKGKELGCTTATDGGSCVDIGSESGSADIAELKAKGVTESLESERVLAAAARVKAKGADSASEGELGRQEEEGGDEGEDDGKRGYDDNMCVEGVRGVGGVGPWGKNIG